MFEPENELERSLMKAATDPSHRPQFYRDLLGSVIYLIHVEHEPLDIQGGVIQTGAKINIEAWPLDGENWLPIFSSLKRLQQCLQAEVTYLQMNVRDFFELTRGANVVLNPNQDYGKEFVPAEIEAMLDGSFIRARQGCKVEFEFETKVLICQPAQYPTTLVEALSRLFSRNRSIKAAYLARVVFQSSVNVPHTLIGIDVDTDADWEVIVGDAGMVATDVVEDGVIVDFIRVYPGDSDLTEYMIRETKPFYRKSLFRRLFG